MGNFYEVMEQATTAMKEAYPLIEKITDKMAFMMVMGTIVDAWCGKQGMSSEETFEMMSQICKAQKDVHVEFGVMG